ncbi:MAG: isoprenylcysteine carboxylmethyltransferase family protein [Castellaniella sp.]|uniref:methyltransferase family protein n=1 Tax=Castellaniella sp. TaxID=1955812 RepID=UPI001210E0EB|nr:isoprenylcysteine carboxylmethyltransferase family protein [Castellaniella sp.]TAN30164.1 MAG: isoprenylcysteine carboxylmethyltransferase family protein [Castellaniella sp.]
MSRLELLVPPPVVMLVVALAMWAVSRTFPMQLLPEASRLVLGIILGLLGVGAGVAGILAFRRARTTTDPRKPARATALVTSGIYRYSRNPMYLGVLLVLAGWAVVLGNPVSALGVLIYALYITRYQIYPEERQLLKTFGPGFLSYKAAVHRWI